MPQTAQSAPNGQHASAPSKAASQHDAGFLQGLVAGQKRPSPHWTSSDEDGGSDQEQAEGQDTEVERQVPQANMADACMLRNRPGSGKGAAASSSRPPLGSQGAMPLRTAAGAAPKRSTDGLRSEAFRGTAGNAPAQAAERPSSAAALSKQQQKQRPSDGGAAQQLGAQQLARQGCPAGAARKRKEMSPPVEVLPPLTLRCKSVHASSLPMESTTGIAMVQIM